MFALELGNTSFPGDHVKELRNAHSHEYKVCLKYIKGYINYPSENWNKTNKNNIMAKSVVPSGKIFDLLLKRREMKKENSKLNLDTDAWYS